MPRESVRKAIRDAEHALAEAGLDSPHSDAEQLAAHVMGVERGRLAMVPLADERQLGQLAELTEQRSRRIPLQYLTGFSSMGAIRVRVGPGVFIPRPETELMLAWAMAELEGNEHPVVVDLCTGSGALALAIVNARPDAEVYAVERDSGALAWARRNSDARITAGDTPIDLRQGDVTDPELLTELDGRVDVVVCNPPYVPDGTELPPEVAGHDPAEALYAGPDGLDVIRPAVGCALRLLRGGGALALEHDESHHEDVTALLRAHRVLTEVTGHTDLAQRPRFATARRVTTADAAGTDAPAAE